MPAGKEEIPFLLELAVEVSDPFVARIVYSDLQDSDTGTQVFFTQTLSLVGFQKASGMFFGDQDRVSGLSKLC
jgi:hypothetical protein